MKFQIQFKDPDVVGDALDAAARMSAAGVAGLDDDERQVVEERRRESLSRLCRKWFRYGEYVTIEIDTDAKTATVVPAE